MRKYLYGALALAAVATAATAVPAFSADSGTVAVSVTAQAPAAPCLTVSPGTVDFGTLPFSTDNNTGIGSGNADITVNFCGTGAGQSLLGSTTPAAGPSGSWTALTQDASGNVVPCPSLNKFSLALFGSTTPTLYMTGTPAPVRGSFQGPPAVFPNGDAQFRLTLVMPCQGSIGAGETKTLTATFTAVVP